MKNKNDAYPLISCLCVTRKRPLYLQKAIAYFKIQSYQNKELLVIYEDDDFDTHNILQRETANDIIPVCVASAKRLNLGQLRNISVEKSRGVFVCQWDDDDWYHCGRLEFQYEVIKMTGKQGCILAKWIIYNEQNKTAYLSYERLWEGSLMCNRDLLLASNYEELARGEDTRVVHNLYRQDVLFLIEDILNLYIYFYHSKNTWDKVHFDSLISASTLLPKNISKKISKIVSSSKIRQEDSLLLDKTLKVNIFN